MKAARRARRIKDDTKREILLYPYVKKYIIKKYFSRKKSPYKVDEHDMVGKILICVILDKRNQKRIKALKGATEQLVVSLNQDMNRHSASQAKLQRANFYFDKMFKDALIEWIIASTYKKVDTKNVSLSIKNFLEYYNIEESEYSYDTAYKYWTRWANWK
jgi:hypothetical protein